MEEGVVAGEAEVPVDDLREGVPQTYNPLHPSNEPLLTMLLLPMWLLMVVEGGFSMLAVRDLPRHPPVSPDTRKPNNSKR